MQIDQLKEWQGWVSEQEQPAQVASAEQVVENSEQKLANFVDMLFMSKRQINKDGVCSISNHKDSIQKDGAAAAAAEDVNGNLQGRRWLLRLLSQVHASKARVLGWWSTMSSSLQHKHQRH
ncbi:hypothetical protein ACA910_020835 [Epithemia clementina (nom. ined.)]